ncbi:MAG: tRNA (N(6)-L-threonylcarbamoyladenosine(37)-C(2))-methylthiotransferase MtaB [Eubacteriales bacterium]|nr:tRNA (N(6)-L-threonylcarbamoyladenosine(37)-C(2))-methylthiotransferase MtaB [Eubacteriales bacterium]
MKKRAALHNLGCKVNAYEIDAMQQLLEEAGYEIVPFAPGADVYVINTCSVTNIADRKSRQMLHKAKKMNPAAIVVAAGCYVQTDKENLEKDEAVDIILGNNQKKNLVQALLEYERTRQKKEQVLEIGREREYEKLAISRTAEHVRAYIKVQDGCNQFCTYCIIPYARGRVRSRDREEVLCEVRRLSQAGYQEVVLTGIHLSSYGSDFPKDTGESLLGLIQAVHEIPGIRRIRLGSLEPRIVTEEFARALATLPKICPHFHLSLQSGCDETLARMNRRYTSEEYRQACSLLRRYFTNPALTTDVIVGFPGETEEEFEISREFVESICFYETHIFKYSRRRGTRAAAMDGQIPEEIKAQRSDVMLALHNRQSHSYEKQWIGKSTELLIEEELATDRGHWLVGHTPEYIKAAVRSTGAEAVNDILPIRLTGFLKEQLMEASKIS